MKTGFFLWLGVISSAAVSCTVSGNHNPRIPEVVEDSASMELPLPRVPDSLKEPGERAAFIAARFWESLDFAHDARSLDTAFMEQNFVNYLSVLNVTPPDSAASSVTRLLSLAKASPKGADLLWDVATRYLDDPNSPMRNEEIYILFLQAAASDNSMPEHRRARAAHRLEEALKNRKGSRAADFRLLSDSGHFTTLYESLGEGTTLLMFYDPDCDVCESVSARMAETPIRKDVKVIAVDITGDEQRWRKGKALFPQEWVNALARDNIEDDGIYVVKATPTFYLLDSNGIVLIKDPLPEEILHVISASD